MMLGHGIGKLVGSLCVLVFSAQVSWAQDVFYECSIERFRSARGWVSPTIGIIVRADNTAQVVDALILNHYEKAIAAKLLRNNSRRLVVKWTLENIRSDSGTSFAYFDYRLSVDVKDGSARLTAQPRHFDGGFALLGGCKERKDRKLR